MLSLVLLLFLLPFFDVHCINLTYIVKKDNDALHPSCIAEEMERYTAVGWVYPIPRSAQELPNITNKFIPAIENPYNCKFSKNSLCVARWFLKDWKVDANSSRTRDALLDNRWEDLPVILITNETKEFSENFDMDNISDLVFSVRVDGEVELLFCEGWNPYNYPCHYFNINYKEIYYKTYPALPKVLQQEYKTSADQYYKAQSNILSHDEWRTFAVSFRADVTLTDLNLKRELIVKESNRTISPVYMFMRSGNSSLWKIHQNHFLFTNTTQISRLGPQVTLPNKDLCVSLLVSTCDNCEMNFFYVNGSTRQHLKNVGPRKGEQWFEIKLKEENVQAETLSLFVETRFLNEKKNSTGGFWAIDDVRICNENEVKVSFLKTNKSSNAPPLLEQDVSCQIIKNPYWRPKKYVYDKIEGFSQINSEKNTTSIKLSWKQEDPSNMISYFVEYAANDICPFEPFNINRVKSNGFISTKLNEVVLKDLIPFTLYNITISSVLHENDEKLTVSTLETEEPLPEELPSKIQLRTHDTSVEISWQEINCTLKYGRLLYTVIVTDNKNFTVERSLQTDTSYTIQGLRPLTQYTLKILTARSAANIYNAVHMNKFNLAFTTLAGVAPPPRNLEIYSIDSQSAHMRFEIPDTFQGLVKEARVKRCLKPSSSKCKTTTYLVRRCPFWMDKYCLDVPHLIPNNLYSFSVALRVSDEFGNESTVDGYSREAVPGKPTNISYKFVDCHVTTDYCYLNITWFHPYNQSSTITAFDIMLETIEQHKDSEDDKKIHEIYKIENETYYSYYTYQIKYIPYSTYYNLSIRSVNNAYVSEFVNLTLRTDNIGDHIDQSPKSIGISDTSLIFKIPHLDSRLDFYKLTIVVQDFNLSKKVDEEVLKNKKVADNLCHMYGDTWISQILKVTNNRTDNIMIGNNERDRLKPNTRYCVTFIVTNKYKGSDHDVVYYEKLRTLQKKSAPEEIPEEKSGGFNPLYLLFLLLLLVPIGFFVYKFAMKKKPMAASQETRENVYETLPFEDCDTNCVENEQYNKLDKLR